MKVFCSIIRAKNSNLAEGISMKRFLVVVLTLCPLLCFCGCTNPNKEHTHKFSAEIITSTCSKEGYTLYTCTTCGFKTMGDFTPALQNSGHNYNNFVCIDCGDFLKDEAVDTVSLQYVKTTDENGNEVYKVTGVADDCEYIKIPSSYNGVPVTQIADEAFRNILELKHVVLPDSIVSIGNSAFKYCFNLLSINIPDSVISIGNEAFWDCNNLNGISLGKVTVVNDYTFIGCTSIENIIIPDSVKTIGVHAFGDCYNLTSIAIPASITKIFHAAFWNDYNLKDIFYEGTMEQWRAINKEVGDYTNTSENASWNAYTRGYTVHCIDGNIAKNETNQ